MSKERQPGICPVCRQRVTVMVDGRANRHGVKRKPCPGYGQVTQPIPPNDVAAVL